MAEGAGGMTYVRMMIDILGKKEVHLSKILEYTKEQEALLKQETFSEEEFAVLVEKKEGLIKKIEEFDDGFQSVYNRMSEELAEHKEQYAEEIRTMQSLIKDITAQTNTIQTQEIRNRESVCAKFDGIREQVKGVRNSQKVVKQYYQNMVNSKKASAQIFDDKK